MSGEAEPARSYYHSGRPHLDVGDLILPPSETGAISTRRAARGDPALEAVVDHVYREDRVYLTADPVAAVLWAALYPSQGGGWIYRVEPIGELEPDPDCKDPGLSFQAPRARILEIVERRISRRRVLAAIGLRAKNRSRRRARV